MVRDFFSLPKLPTLHSELQAIKEKCDPDLFAAILAVKSVGNIGAHPERDVSLMVDVEPDEPETLLQLIHLLDQEWYVARAERQRRIDKMKELGRQQGVCRRRCPKQSTGCLAVTEDAQPGIVLSPDEIVQITGGYRRPSEQVEELRRQGFWRARRSRATGQAILERAHFIAV